MAFKINHHYEFNGENIKLYNLLSFSLLLALFHIGVRCKAKI